MVGFQFSSRGFNKFLLFGQPDSERFHNGSRDLILDGKQIPHVALISLRPYLIAIRHAYQLGGNPDSIARGANATFKHGGNTELAANISDIRVSALEPK